MNLPDMEWYQWAMVAGIAFMLWRTPNSLSMLMAPFRKKKTNEAAAEDLTEELIVVAKKLYAKDCSVADNAANAVADYIRMCMTATLTAKLKSIKPTEEESDETDE